MKPTERRERGSAGQHPGGAVKKGWPTKTLGDVCQLISGQHIDAKDYNTESRGVGYLTGPSDFGLLNPIITKWTEHPKIKAKRGDVLITVKGSGVGKINLLDEDEVAISRQLMAVRVTGAEPSFIHVILSSTFDHFQSLSTGAAIPGISREQVLGLTIALPPLAEQQRIVAILDEAFEGLATAKANAEKNLHNARALFESHLQSVFTQRGPGWVETTIGETCTLKSGTTVSPTLEKPIGDIPYLKVADMTFDGNEDQITTSSRFLCDADVRESAIIPKGATIFPKRGGAILTNKKRITSLPICADLNIMAVIPSSQIDAGLLYFYFLNVDMRKLGTGSSIPQINNYDVSPLRISFPKSLTTQSQIARKLDDLREETQRLARLCERKLAALEELKKSLLHKAFTGGL